MSLTVLSRAANANADARNKGNARDRMRCHCGFEFVVRASHRKSGKVTQCYRCEKREPSANEIAKGGINA